MDPGLDFFTRNGGRRISVSTRMLGRAGWDWGIPRRWEGYPASKAETLKSGLRQRGKPNHPVRNGGDNSVSVPDGQVVVLIRVGAGFPGRAGRGVSPSGDGRGAAGTVWVRQAGWDLARGGSPESDRDGRSAPDGIHHYRRRRSPIPPGNHRDRRDWRGFLADIPQGRPPVRRSHHTGPNITA